MPRLKVLHYPANYPDPQYGQPFNMIFVAEHIRASALYHENIVLYVSPLASESGKLEVTRTTEENIQVIRIHTPRTNSEILNRVVVYAAVAMELLFLFAKGFFPQIIHAHIFSSAKIPAKLAQVLRIPLIITEHWSALCMDGMLSAGRLRSARKIYQQAKTVLPVSQCLQHCMENNTGAKFNGHVIFNTVNTQVFYYGPQEHKKQIISVMRLEAPKDVSTLLHSLALLEDKNTALKIIGRGDAAPFQALAQELEISDRVEFLGEQPKTHIAELMRESSVFVLSSLWENSPCVIGEALCCGLPVVATNVGGVPELFTQADGRLAPPSHPLLMARAIEEILNNPQQFNQKDIAERAHAKFSYEAIGAQLDMIYREAILD